MESKLVLERATNDQAEEISNLVNLAYRGPLGWTKETHIVTGERSNIAEVQGYLSDPMSYLLVASDNGEIKACICIEENGDCAYIGFFAVHPMCQGVGVGKEILSQAERFAINELKLKKFKMAVVSQRSELISFYERRGYVKTGEIQEYPVHLNVGVPLESGLTIEYLEKNA